MLSIILNFSYDKFCLFKKVYYICLMKLFKDTASKSNLFVIIFFVIMSIIAFSVSGCDDKSQPIIIKSKDSIVEVNDSI